MERLLNFLAEDRDEGDEVATETDQGHGQEQDSLQQEGQHAVDSLIFLLKHTLKLQTKNSKRILDPTYKFKTVAVLKVLKILKVLRVLKILKVLKVLRPWKVLKVLAVLQYYKYDSFRV